MGVFYENYCRRLVVGSLVAPSNALMAPIYGCTNVEFRRVVENFGAGIAFTEMTHVECLLKKKESALECARFDSDEKIKALQLIGGEPNLFHRLVEGSFLEDVDLIDVNMGCAVPDIVRSGRGCALVHDLPRASQIVEACKKSGKAVSVKCRPGMTLKEGRVAEFARMCEESGADMLTVHGRPGEMRHEGPVSYDAIAEAKASVRIPVVGNGGVCTEADAAAMMRETGVDGIMIGRAAVENPQIFGALTGKSL